MRRRLEIFAGTMEVTKPPAYDSPVSGSMHPTELNVPHQSMGDGMSAREVLCFPDRKRQARLEKTEVEALWAVLPKEC